VFFFYVLIFFCR